MSGLLPTCPCSQVRLHDDGMGLEPLQASLGASGARTSQQALGIPGAAAHHLPHLGMEPACVHPAVSWPHSNGSLEALIEDGTTMFRTILLPAAPPMQPGAIMAEKYVRMATMKSLTSAPQGAGIPDLIGIVARCAKEGGLAWLCSAAVARVGDACAGERRCAIHVPAPPLRT